MNLVKCKPSAHTQYVRCLSCGYARSISVMWADLDGPPFQAYYCPNCIGVSPDGQIIVSKKKA